MDFAQRVDLVVFGASGFTGFWAVREVEKLAVEKKLTWAIAGRSENKLKDVLIKLAKETGKDFLNTRIIVADVGDEKALLAMAQQVSVVVNCCGPYRHWGEPVVKACVAGGAHYVDVSGEPQFMERMQLEYNEAAEKKGVYIVSACGFDSIPADLGAVHLQRNFPGDINSIETYIKSWTKGPATGPSIHYGTWESAVYGVAHYGELRPLRQRLYPTPLPKMLPKLKARGVLFQSQVSRGWCLPFPGADRSVMQRTQRFLYENERKRPAQIQTYITFPSLLAAIAVAFVTIFFAIMCKFSLGRKLLLQHPRLFSLGFISHEGPSDDRMRNTHFEVIVVGRGWSERAKEPTDVHDNAPDQEIVVKVSGTNPGYGATCTALVLAGITILKESDKMPRRYHALLASCYVGNQSKLANMADDQQGMVSDIITNYNRHKSELHHISGGVFTPGAAFANTSLVKELHSHGVKFEVIPHQSRL